MPQPDIADGASPATADFSPTHLIHLAELPHSERETYFDLLIASDAHFHRDYTSGAVLADMRILGPGVTMPGASPKKKQDGPRLTPKEKLALQSANAATLRLPGALTCAAGDVFNYSRYNSTVKLLSQAAPTYAPKRRTLAWTVRLIQEIYDERYKRDTSDIGGGEEFEEMDEERVAAARAKEEITRQTNVFPIFVVDLFSKKYGLKSLVESTTWDLLYSCDCLRGMYADVEVFCRFLEMSYDADELLYYCYVRSLTQSVLNANFKTHWADAGRQNNPGNVGFDRRPPVLALNRRECNYIAQTIFIRNQGEEVESEKQMFSDFMGSVDGALADGAVDSSEFMKIAVERYFATRPGEHTQDAVGEDANEYANEGGAAPPLAPSRSEEAAAAAAAAVEEGGGEEEVAFTSDNWLFNAIWTDNMDVETAEKEYIERLMASDAFSNLPAEVLDEVRSDLNTELSQRITHAEEVGAEYTKESDFLREIGGAIEGFDAMAQLVLEHVQAMFNANSFKSGAGE